MFPSMWTKQFVAAACVLFGICANRPAFAGPIFPVTPSEIDGDYEADFDNQQQNTFPLTFTLIKGAVNNPMSLAGPTGLTPADLTVNETSTSSGGPNPPSVTVTLSDFILSGTLDSVTGTIDYATNSPQLESSSVIVTEVTLTSNTFGNSIVNLVNLNPALLTITFPSSVNLDPSWPSQFVPGVEFTLSELPEPASVVYLGWVGAFGVISAWRRHRRAALG